MKFLQYIGDLFRDNEGHPSMARVLSLLFGVASVIYMFDCRYSLSERNFKLVIILAIIAMLGKNIQKVLEMWLQNRKLGG